MFHTQDLAGVSHGADFRRADLHIHSFGPQGSYDVTGMTPAGIIEAALRERIEVIAITDHNEIGNVPTALSYADGKSLLVVPGVELSTSQGHLLAYFPDFPSLKNFFGKLTITADRKGCSDTIEQCLALASQHGGFGVLAHIELDAGFELMMPKPNQFKEQILRSIGLLGLEIARKETESWYTKRDDDPDRKRLRQARIDALKLEDGYEFAKLMSSDAHTVNALGKNAAGNRRLTRLKMEDLSFFALQVALHDAVARVRIEDVIPQDVPRFVGMRLTGGFLDRQTVHFSKNLTCIIGGRGTGKSTLLECLRVTAGATIRRDDIIDSEVWPTKIELIYQDEAGQQHILNREAFSETENESDPLNGLTKIPIESYGQGDTAETIQHCDEKPEVLLQFLDDFINIAELLAEDDRLRQTLLDNQTLVERLTMDVATIPATENAKKQAESQMRALKEKNAPEFVELEAKLANGRQFRQQLIADLKATVKTARNSLGEADALDFLFLERDPSQLPVGKDEFARVSERIQELSRKLATHSEQIKGECDDAVREIEGLFNTWIAAETEIQARIETIRKELEARGVKLDVAFIKKVTKDVAEHDGKLKQLQKKKADLEKHRKDRRDLITERQQVRSRIFTERSRFAASIEANLRSTIADYTINVKFHEGRLSPELEDIIKEAMEWRTSRVPKAATIARAFTPLQVAQLVQKKEALKLTALLDDGERVFTSAEAQQIIERLSELSVLCRIERCAFEDRPEVKVSKVFPAGDAPPKIVTKDFGKLSLGQQQAILLSIMLFSRNNSPLIIDQPEDNLDSEFIYKTFVKTLRNIKERRQVVIVTHNANIAVLGDAELILPLKATHSQSSIHARGSIDSTPTRDLACLILEGSEEAFKKRQRIYGF